MNCLSPVEYDMAITPLWGNNPVIHNDFYSNDR
nr:MAG TPA: hypothetical protein [Caudoviricetes sp.]